MAPIDAIPACTIQELDASCIRALEIAGEEAVICQRRCPHLDEDLAAGQIVDGELVCPAHGWSITIDGRACKRNEFGRTDDKGTVRTWQALVRDGIIYAVATADH
jgi:phenylpropionate dioxygenase-like ring-hydroxylating dioxygenase large terminal subunit